MRRMRRGGRSRRRRIRMGGSRRTRRSTERSTAMIIKPIKITGKLFKLSFIPHPTGNNNSNDHEGSLNSTCRFSYRFGADRTEEIVHAARARTVRFK